VLADTDLGSLSEVQLRRHRTNCGANAARNTGIDAASGEYVAFLDDDDRWHPEKLTRQVRTVERHADAGVVYTGIERVLPEGTREEIPRAVEGDMTKALLCENVVGSMSVAMVRTELARSVPLDERFPCWADLEWYINLSRETEFVRVPEPLVVYDCDSAERLSRDFEKTHAGYELFLEEFDSLASGYGPLFRRKMRGWAAFRAGKSAFHDGRYDRARELLGSAVRSYPFEPAFTTYLLASLGDRRTHRLASAVGDVARPDRVVFTPELPKTRSGKIMRRLLEDIARGEEFGDVSALRNPEVVGEIESTVREMSR